MSRRPDVAAGERSEGRGGAGGPGAAAADGQRPASRRRRETAAGLVAWVVPERNPAGAVYGLITVGALLAAETKIRDTYAETVGAVALTMVVYWFAHSYAALLGGRLETGVRPGRRQALATVLHDGAILEGASLPLLALLGAWALGASQHEASEAAVWVAVGALVVFEVAAGLRTRSTLSGVALDGFVGALMGLAILALKTILA